MPTFTLQAIAEKISAKIVGDPKKTITQVAPLYRATATELTYLAHNSYRKLLSNTSAGAVILKEENAKDCPTIALIVNNPELAFATIARLFEKKPEIKPGVHPTAVIDPSAKIHPTASIGALCVIGENVVIGEQTVLHPQVTVEQGVTIGQSCEIHAHASIYHDVTLKDRVVIESGAVIGRDGFGMAQHEGVFHRIPQLGSVIINNDVWIGANSCIDRGAIDNTVIETGVKIDNLVQIAHNVRIGAHTVIAGCTGIAGSTVIGKHCLVGGSTAIGDHLTICDKVILTGCAMVTSSIKTPGIYSSGTGLMPNRDWLRAVVRFKRPKRKSAEEAD